MRITAITTVKFVAIHESPRETAINASTCNSQKTVVTRETAKNTDLTEARKKGSKKVRNFANRILKSNRTRTCRPVRTGSNLSKVRTPLIKTEPIGGETQRKGPHHRGSVGERTQRKETKRTSNGQLKSYSIEKHNESNNRTKRHRINEVGKELL